MTSASFGVEEDRDVRAALDWFYQLAMDAGALQERIGVAQAFFRSHAAPKGWVWPGPSDLLLKSDLIASYLAQAHSLLHDNRSYDLTLGAHIVPFIKHIGRGVSVLRTMPGVTDRVRRLLNPRQEHPDGGLYELVAAVRYAHEGLEVEFVPETAAKSPDIRVGEPGGTTKDLYIECKRLRPSDYELRENIIVHDQFEALAKAIHDRKLSVTVDIQFLAELAKIPRDYLLDRVQWAISSSLLLPNGYPWKDEYASGVIRPAAIDRVRYDSVMNGPLIVGAKMLRLLTGKSSFPNAHLIALKADSAVEDARYVDNPDYASVLTWQSLAPQSVEARARHILSLLAKIDRQLAEVPMGIAHIGMYAERDTLAADLRRKRNLEAVRQFRARSKLVEVYLHYYLPQVAETTSWTILETADSNSRLDSPFLDDPRLLSAGDSLLDTDVAAWHVPPPGA